MLSILSAVLGFATSGLPSVLDFFKQKGDQKHEQSMARLDMERALALAEKGYASQERIEEFRTDQVEMETYAQERIALYNHDKKLSEGASPWVINLRASVRPIITYIFVFIVLFIDIVGLIWAIKSGVDFVTAIRNYIL
jgi:multidrug resistance efflux pump